MSLSRRNNVLDVVPLDGTRIKATDHTEVSYQLIGKNDIDGLPATIYLKRGDRVYYKEKSTVKGDKVTFTLNEIGKPGDYILEIIVAGKYRYPSDNASHILVTDSIDTDGYRVIEQYGKDQLIEDVKKDLNLDVQGNYVVSQPTSSTTWTVVHPLNRYPSVTCVDTQGRVIYGDVKYISPQKLEICFSVPVSGTVYLN